jgi:transcriptional regulator GlxA family with amidase domain
MTKLIAFFIFDDFQILDLTGPLAAFEIAGRLAPGAYALKVVAVRAGSVRSSSGLEVLAEGLREDPMDTLVVAGGQGTLGAVACQTTLGFIATASMRARRTTSVCSGAFLLAAAGLLDGRRATTHWRRAPDLARKFPKATVLPDRIFVRDDPVWTSAGITAGIDLALALIADDLGDAVAARTAKELVAQHRSGGQSQFSALSELPIASDRIGAAIAFARDHLAEPLPVERLAEAARLSPRQFARAFRSAVGTTPAKVVERLRVEAARAALEGARIRLDAVAQASGFGEPERMRRAFVRVLGHPPQALRRASAARDPRPSADELSPAQARRAAQGLET